jgi:hypothetical protein
MGPFTLEIAFTTCLENRNFSPVFATFAASFAALLTALTALPISHTNETGWEALRLSLDSIK